MCVNNLPKVATQWNSGATRDSNRGRRVLIPSALTSTPPSHTEMMKLKCWCVCSSTLRAYLEQWLRLMLRWDADKRGGPRDVQSQRLQCFKLLEQIISVKVSDCVHYLQDHPHHSACLSELCS